MPQWFTKKIEEKEQALYVTPKPPQTESVRLTGNATKDLSNIRAALHDTADFMVREITVCGIPVKLMMFEGMFSLQTLTEIMLEPLGDLTLDEPSAQALRDWVCIALCWAWTKMRWRRWENYFLFSCLVLPGL